MIKRSNNYSSNKPNKEQFYLNRIIQILTILTNNNISCNNNKLNKYLNKSNSNSNNNNNNNRNSNNNNNNSNSSQK